MNLDNIDLNDFISDTTDKEWYDEKFAKYGIAMLGDKIRILEMVRDLHGLPFVIKDLYPKWNEIDIRGIICDVQPIVNTEHIRYKMMFERLKDGQ